MFKNLDKTIQSQLTIIDSKLQPKTSCFVYLDNIAYYDREDNSIKILNLSQRELGDWPNENIYSKNIVANKKLNFMDYSIVTCL